MLIQGRETPLWTRKKGRPGDCLAVVCPSAVTTTDQRDI